MKCKDIAKKYGVHHLSVGKRRKRFFPKSTGGELSQEEQDTLIAYYESIANPETKEALKEAVQPQYVIGVVSYVPVNKSRVNEVVCKIREKDGSISKVECLVPPQKNADKMLFQKIKMEVITVDIKRPNETLKGVKLYRHASLSNIAWPKKYIS